MICDIQPIDLDDACEFRDLFIGELFADAEDLCVKVDDYNFVVVGTKRSYKTEASMKVRKLTAITIRWR